MLGPPDPVRRRLAPDSFRCSRRVARGAEAPSTTGGRAVRATPGGWGVSLPLYLALGALAVAVIFGLSTDVRAAARPPVSAPSVARESSPRLACRTLGGRLPLLPFPVHLTDPAASETGGTTPSNDREPGHCLRVPIQTRRIGPTVQPSRTTDGPWLSHLHVVTGTP